MQIGDKVWIFDSNRRTYEDDQGNKLRSPWYRGYFVERFILGETKQSWIIGWHGATLDSRGNYKVNKKTLTYTNSYGGNFKIHTSEEEIDRECWIQENQYKIREAVGFCKDYEKLKKIEEILKIE
jgi:hypothetical protein